MSCRRLPCGLVEVAEEGDLRSVVDDLPVIGVITAVLVMAAAAVETDVWWRIMVIAGVTVLLFWLLVPGSSALGAIAVRGLLPVVPVPAFGLRAARVPP